MKQLRPAQFAAFVLLAAVYIAVRFWGLTDSCLWFDEIFSVHAAEHPWNELFSFVALDLIHPPLSYVLLKLWIGVGGESLFWLRLFPVVFAVIAIFPFISLCRDLKLPFWTQMLALSFFAVNGSLIKYAQEVRMYSLLMCLSLFSMWLFARYSGRGKSFIPLLVVNILLVYSHYFGWFVVLSEVAAILIFQRAKWRRILTMFGITFASFVPWMIAVWQAANAGSEVGQNIGWMTRPGLKAIGQFALNLVEPFYYQASSAEPVSIFRVSLPVLLIVVAAMILYFAYWKQKDAGKRQTVKLLGLFAALPLIFAFAASWLLPYSVWGTRHLIVVFAPVLMLLAYAVVNIPEVRLKTAAITLVLLLSGYAFVIGVERDKPVYSWCAWGPMTLEAETTAPADIYTFEDLVAYHVWFAKKDQATPARVFRIRDMSGLAEDTAYFLPRGFDEVRTVPFVGIEDRGLWIAYRFKSVDENEPPLRNFLLDGYHVADQRVMSAAGEGVIFLYLGK